MARAQHPVHSGCVTNAAAVDLTRMTPDEKLALIDELWDSLSAEEPSLTPAQRAELDRRLARLEREGAVGTPWEDVRAAMSSTDR